MAKRAGNRQGHSSAEGEGQGGQSANAPAVKGSGCSGQGRFDVELLSRPRAPGVAAFQFGSLLNQLDWLLQQAWLHIEDDSMRQAERIFNTLVPVAHHLAGDNGGGEILESRMTALWEDIRTQFFKPRYMEEIQRLNTRFLLSRGFQDCFERTRRRYCDMLVRPIRHLVEGIQSAAGEVVGGRHDLGDLLRVGMTVDQGSRPIDYTKFSFNTEGLDWAELRSLREQAADVGTQPSPWVLTRGRTNPGEISPPAHWFGKVRAIWHRLGIDGPLPSFFDELEALWHDPAFQGRQEVDYVRLDLRVTSQLKRLVVELEATVVGFVSGPTERSVTEGGPSGTRQTRMPREEANILVRDYLDRHPRASIRKVVKATGVSQTSISNTTAWKAAQETKKAGRPSSDKGNRRLTAKMLASVGKREDPSAEIDTMEHLERMYIEKVSESDKVDYYQKSKEDKKTLLLLFGQQLDEGLTERF
jgi:hypothetical protein